MDPFTLAFLPQLSRTQPPQGSAVALACWTLRVLSSGHGAAFLAVAIVVLFAWRFAFGQPVTWRQWLRDSGAAGAYLIAPSIWILLPYRAAQTDAGLRRGYLFGGMPTANDFLASPSRVHAYLQEWLLGSKSNDTANAFLFRESWSSCWRWSH